MPSNVVAKGVKAGWSNFESGWGADNNANIRRLAHMAMESFSFDSEASAGLSYVYRGGIVVVNGFPTLIPSGTVVLTANATNYIQYNSVGAVSCNTVGFAINQTRVAQVVTGPSSIALVGGAPNIIDWRLGNVAKADPESMRFAGTPFYDAMHPTYGAQANGTTSGVGHDDRAALLAACADAARPGAQQGILQLIPGSGGYRIASNVMLTCTHLRAIPGARLLPDNGVVVTLDVDHIDAGAYFILDTSNGGSFVFSKVKCIKGEWYIKWADGITPDTAELNALGRDITDFMLCTFEKRLTLVLDDTWRMDTERFGFNIIAIPGALPNGQGVELRWHGPIDGTMMFWNHIEYATFAGFHIRAGHGAIAGYAGVLTSGNHTLTEASSFGQFQFTNIVGHKVFVFDETNTLVFQSHVQSVETGNSLTLVDAAPQNFDTVYWIVGATATSGPAKVDFDWDYIGDGPISTQCLWADNIFRQDWGMIGHVHLRWSYTSVNNCENAKALRCIFSGGGMSTVYFSPYENGTSVATTAGDTLVTITGFGTVNSNFIGQTIRIPYGGGVDGNGDPLEYVGKFKTYIDATHFRVRNPITTTTAGQRLFIGDENGEGIHNGYSSNALRQTVEHCTFSYLAKGIFFGSGSINTFKCSNTGNGIDVHLENHACPCHLDCDDSEAARQKLVVGLKGAARNGCTVRMTDLRMPPSRMRPHEGFVAFHHCECSFISDNNNLGNVPQSDGFLWDFRAATGVFNIKGTNYFQPPTMAQAGYNNIGPGATLISDHERNISGAPSPYFRKYGSDVTSGDVIVVSQVGGYQSFPAPVPQSAVPDAQILNNQVVPFIDSVNAAGRLPRLGLRFRDNFGNLSSIFPETTDVVELTEGTNVAVNASLGNLYALHVTSAATRNISAPTGQQYGHSISFLISNETAGAIDVRWNGAYALLGAGAISLWVNPAPGKRKRIKFTFYKLWVSWEFESMTPDYSQ